MDRNEDVRRLTHVQKLEYVRTLLNQAKHTPQGVHVNLYPLIREYRELTHTEEIDGEYYDIKDNDVYNRVVNGDCTERIIYLGTLQAMQAGVVQ